MMPTPTLLTQNDTINRAFRIALGDIQTNIRTYQAECLPIGQNVLLAGLDYNDPWTRDAAINTWNGAGLLFPEVARNTLVSVLTHRDGSLVIGGEYWDAIIWACGAWAYYTYTGDRSFLATTHQVICDSLARFEHEEYNPETGLFRGAACYGDGIAAYPDRYAQTGGSSNIVAWVKQNPGLAASPGVGLPMQTLSTNCLYYQAYRLLPQVEKELGIPVQPHWEEKADAIKRAIQKHFWSAELGRYRYLVDPFGGCDRQEGLGHAFALLFDIPSTEQKEAIFQHVEVTPFGIACVHPTYERYHVDTHSFGRHSGTVWPHVQGFWAHAAALNGKQDIFAHELLNLAKLADRDCQFVEIYHPITGAVYGGLQEGLVGEWHSCLRQTWSATAFIRMILMGVLGMQFEPGGITFKPFILSELGDIQLSNLPYRKMTLNIEIHVGKGLEALYEVDNEKMSGTYLAAEGKGRKDIRIYLPA